ncbi:unnamed protein product [Discosporangium mesarthrocarpum]
MQQPAGAMHAADDMRSDVLASLEDVDSFLEKRLAISLEDRILKKRLGSLSLLKGVLEVIGCTHSANQSEGPGLTRPQTRTLARLLLNAIACPKYLERVWLRGLCDAISAAATSRACPNFVPVCVVNLAGMAEASTDGSGQIAILRIAQVIIKSTVRSIDLETVPEWLSRLIVLQALVHEKLGAKGDRKLLVDAAHLLRGGLLFHEPLLEVYLNILTRDDKCGESSVALSVVTSFCISRTDYKGAIKSHLLKVYVQSILMAKSGINSQYKLDSFAPLLGSLTSDDFLVVLQPVFEKLQKKNPDSILVAVVSAVKQLRIDLSAQAGSLFLPPLLRQLRSPKENIRVLAVDLMGSLATRCCSPEVLKNMVTELCYVLAGKSGVLAQWYQRQCVIRALLGVCKGFEPPKLAAAAPAAMGAMSALVPVIEKESHEETRALGLKCMSLWLLMVDSIPLEVLQLFKKGASHHTKSVAAAYLVAVSDLGESVSCLAQLTDLVPSLLQRVEVASRKPNTFSPDAILAAKVLLDMAAVDSDTRGELCTKFPWAVLKDGGSFLYPPAMLSPYPLDAPSLGEITGPLASNVCTALCNLLASAATDHALEAALFEQGKKQANLSSASNAACLALVQCMVHLNKDVRQAALGAALRIHDAEDQGHRYMLNACEKIVLAAASEKAKVGLSLPSGDKEDQAKVIPPPSRFLAAVFSCAGSGPHKDMLPLLLLLVHHPLVCHSRKGAKNLWRHVQRRAFGGVDGVNKLFEDKAVVGEVVSSLWGAAQSRSQLRMESAHWALTSLGSQCGEGGCQLLTRMFFPKLLQELKSSEVLSLSTTEVEIFFTPEGTLHRKPSKKKNSTAVSKNAARRGKDAEEVEWEERVRAELGAKSKTQLASKGRQGFPVPSGKGNKPAEEEGEIADLLREEAAVRKKVEGVQHLVNAALQGLRAGFCSCMDLGYQCIPSALPVLLPLLTCRLVESQAYQCVQSLASTASNELSGTSNIAPALLAIQTKPETASGSTPVDVCLMEISRSCMPPASDEQLLEPHTLWLVFPVLEAVLAKPSSSAHCEAALKIVALHSDMEYGSGNECHPVMQKMRELMIKAVLSVVDRFPQMEPGPDVILATLCTGGPLNTGEWALLLGNIGLLCEAAHVRLACLEAVMMMVLQGQVLIGDPLLESRLWLSKYDTDAENAALAAQVWEARGGTLSQAYVPPLLVLLSHKKSYVRHAAARALAGGMKEHPGSSSAVLSRLYELYSQNSPPQPQAVDKKLDMDKFFAMPPGGEAPVVQHGEEGWQTRSGVAKALEAVGAAKALDEEEGAEELEKMFLFLVQKGLSDYNDVVRGQMLSAGMVVITAYGEGSALRFLHSCEAVMMGKHTPSEDMQSLDWRREGVVVFMGSAAKHLEKEDPKIVSIVQTLADALSTPAEAVQVAVSDCLAPLVKTAAMKEQAPELLQKLLQRCVGRGTYGERRGAAYGVAAVVKGLGISAFKKHNVISTLEDACRGTSIQGKQGGLCAFECMCVRLGLLFEPYVIVILPLLLKCFSDSSNHVREAAHDCARAIMSNLSAHGVKRVLPAILKSLSDPAWRTKQGAIELLGSMAYCAPRQLSDCLPMIVPKLTDAFADTHPKVRESARKALEDIGSVIRNPEVASLSMTLMAALSDPSKHTKAALEALLACEFMHSIDAPSLALLVPVLQRGLKDRSAEVKRKAALITGNTCSMISDAKNLLPYLSAIVPGLKATCIDPIPDVRASAAKALGALVRGMGEEKVGDLVPWLVETLKADSSSSERSGGAQGLSEVLVVLGVDRARAVLEELLPLAAHPKSAVREGVLWVLCFLPGTMMRDFSPIIPQALPVVLAGLSDEAEPVREVALRSGQVLVSTHGKTQAAQLLPALERGLFDDNWRIRQSSVQLLGDLLYLIGNTKEVTASEDNLGGGETRGSTRAGEAIEEVLGPERCNNILASLYLVRSDTSSVVRQSALQVWKTVVPNTPKALREILHLLIGQIVTALASGNSDNRTVAGRALGDIVKKLGDQVLPEVVPFLRQGLETGDENMRQGVCLGLTEIMECATLNQVEDFIDTLVPAIQDALCDLCSRVRKQSGQAFHTLYRAVGIRAIERIIPSLLKQLGEEGDDDHASKEYERAVFGLKEVLQLRPRDVLPYLVPKLVVRPISLSHARALGAAAEVTGSSIHFHLASLVPFAVRELAVLDCEVGSPAGAGAGAGDVVRVEKMTALKTSMATLVSSVETVGVNTLCHEMTKMLSKEDAKQRKWAGWLVQQFISGTQADFEQEVPFLLKELLHRLVDTDKEVLVAVWNALKALNAQIPAEEMVCHLTYVKGIIASIISDSRHRRGAGDLGEEFLLPGVNIPRGLEPLLPMYQQGLMYGTRDVREAAASGIGELVEVTGQRHLQPFIIKITGPLIRIVGDRFPPGVKAAILHTLGLLLSKGGVSLKPFVPQLQTTFVKALSDSNKPVRDRGLTALGHLMKLSTRFDPLITELMSGASSTSADTAVRVTLLEALAEVMRQAGEKASPLTVSLMIEGLSSLLEDSEHDVQEAAARAMGCAQKTEREKGMIV